ncbi:hypothetical protein [Microbacterium sp. E-13]|uniref:hypothetical protein n=1 Tax=Microbacterium sp. E-13 TaxID=3404048 RepID=UPI003CEBAFAD
MRKQAVIRMAKHRSCGGKRMMHSDVKRRAALASASAVVLILLLAGCAVPSELPAVSGRHVSFRSVVGTDTLSGKAPQDELDVPHPAEPVEVAVMGAAVGDLEDTVTVEELVEVADDLGQDVIRELEAGEASSSEEATVFALWTTVAGQQSLVAESTSMIRSAVTAYTRVMAWNDNKYVPLVLRQGTSTWGWVKIRDKHAATQTMVKKTTQFPRTRTVSGTNIYYTTPAIKYTCWFSFCTIDKQMDVHVVYETTRQSDGAAKGVITAYCVGVTVCPQWVRDVAG